MQTNNNPNRGKSYTPSKGYNNNDNAQEPEQPRTELSNLFKPPSDPDEAEAERDKLYGRTPRNTNKSGSFTL